MTEIMENNETSVLIAKRNKKGWLVVGGVFSIIPHGCARFAEIFTFFT